MTMEDEKLSGATQENLLTLLCFDQKFAPLVRQSLKPSLFESAIYREIAGQAMDYIDQFKEPIKDHLPDVLEHILEGSDTRKASAFKKTLENLYHAKDVVNAEFVVSQLNKFIRQQNIKSAIVKAVECLEDGKVDEAEVEVQKALNSQAVSFDLGLDVRDSTKSMRFLDLTEDGFFTNIKELDENEAMPRRKEITIFIAPRGRGKSWFLTHMSKMALLQRATVLLVSLEMSEERYSQRILQSFFSVSKREEIVRVPVFSKDSSGVLENIDYEDIQRRTLRDPNIREYLQRRIDREFKRRPPLIVKSFPTGALTIPMLRAYLDGLDRFHKIVPDVIMVDYPDLMQVDSKNMRVDIGRLYADLRGIAVERNAAMIVPSQGNREAEGARWVTGQMAAEDISKLATADTVITYSQTPGEKKLGLARLLVEKSRNDKDKFQVLISQAYQMGQFCLDSSLMSGDYWEMVEGRGRGYEEED